jgi:hypothetical protein
MSKGLTGIEETARGFVGKTVSYGKTLSGKPKIRFDIACGDSDEQNGKFSTWRHVYIYGDVAFSLKDLKHGDLVKVTGWVQTEGLFNEFHQAIIDQSTGLQVKTEKLICFKGEKVSYEKKPQEKQLEFA